MSCRRLCTLYTLLGLAACGVNPPPPQAALYTLDSLSAAAHAGDPEALFFITPPGGTIPFLSDPYVPGARVRQAQWDGINVFPSYVEGAPGAYGVTEYWDEFPAVWLQPLYFLITGFDPNTGAPVFLQPPQDQPRAIVFSVGTGSRFYSPYWQIYYALVPPGAQASDYSSEKRIFDAGLPLTKGAVTFCAIGPAGSNLVWDGQSKVISPTGEMHLTFHPLTGVAIPLRQTAYAYVDDQVVWFIDFGRNRYRALDDGTIEADALFEFGIRNPADGTFVPLGLPKVGGTGPLGHWRPPQLVQGQPQFGSFWHEYRVLLNVPNPRLALNDMPAPFIPTAATGLRALVKANAGGGNYGDLVTHPPSPQSEAAAAQNGASLADYTLRVALNPTACFVNPNPAFPGGPCIWLDSQQAIENYIASALITDRERYSSCPLVVYGGKAVP